MSTTAPAVENALEVAHLRKVFKIRKGAPGQNELVAVDDVSFAVPRSGSLAVVGESGSGKTTLARMIVGLEIPTRGQVLLDGQIRQPSTRRRDRAARARQVQMVFQDPYSSLDPRQTVFNCLDEVMRLHSTRDRAKRAERVGALLDQVGLDDRHHGIRPSSLSGGQRQRVAIARALATEPTVLILDEAVSALDVSVQGQVLNLLADLRERLGVTYVFVSHDLAVVQQIAETTIVMHRGRIVEEGPTDTILTSPSHEYTQRLLSALPRPGWRPRRRATTASAPSSPD
jgi:ABC-type glutathione transport system ATPase component